MTAPSNVPAVTLGIFILWLGWFGFNGGSQLALSGAVDAIALSNILANTNLAAAAGVLAAITLSRPIMGRVDLITSLNGAIAGLVAITAGPDIVDHYFAVIIGAIGGAIVVLGVKLLEMVKVDDVVGAVPAHLFAGVWGTLAVCIAAGGDPGRADHRHPGHRSLRVRHLPPGVVHHRQDPGGTDSARCTRSLARMQRNSELSPTPSSC